MRFVPSIAKFCYNAERRAPNANTSTEPSEQFWCGINQLNIDRKVHAALARTTSGLSPVFFMEAEGDWAVQSDVSAFPL